MKIATIVSFIKAVIPRSLGSSVLSKKVIILVFTLIGIICTIFITDDEGTRTIIKLIIQMLNSIQGGAPAPS